MGRGKKKKEREKFEPRVVGCMKLMKRCPWSWTSQYPKDEGFGVGPMSLVVRNASGLRKFVQINIVGLRLCGHKLHLGGLCLMHVHVLSSQQWYLCFNQIQDKTRAIYSFRHCTYSIDLRHTFQPHASH